MINPRFVDGEAKMAIVTSEAASPRLVISLICELVVLPEKVGVETPSKYAKVHGRAQKRGRSV